MSACRSKLNMDVELMFRIRKLASLVIGLLTKTRRNPLGGGLVLALSLD
jgi:hypothetical protein